MENIGRQCLLILFLLCIACEEKTESSIRITGVFPSSNPRGGPVKIVGEGFGEETEVYFEGNLAVVEQRSDTFLTTRVPTGVSGLGISIKVEDANGSDELSDHFDVLSDFPSDLPTSPPSIFIPAQSLSSALPYTISDADLVWHMNVYDRKHILGFLFRRENDDYRSVERMTLDGTYYSTPILIDGEELFKYDKVSGVAIISSVEVDRSNSSPAGHPIASDEYNAVYFSMENFDFPPGFLDNQGDIVFSDSFLLLESKTSGRQYLFVVYCPDPIVC